MITQEDIQRFGAIKSELLPLATASELSDVQRARYDELSAEFDTLAPKIEDAQAFDAKRKTDVERMSRLNPVSGREVADFESDPLSGEGDKPSTFKNPWDRSEVARSQNSDDLIARALSAAEMTPGPDDLRRQALTAIIEREGDERIARLILATTSPEYKSAYGKIARSGGSTADLDAGEREAVHFANTVKRAMSAGTDNAGGYLVPTDIEAAVTLSSVGTTNPVYDLARKVQTTSDTYRVVTSPHAAWSWDGENTEVSDDTPTFANTDIDLRIAQGFVPYSYAAGNSIGGITSVVASVLMGGWNDLVGAALTTGPGTTTPIGIVTALTGGSSEINAVGEAIAIADLYALVDALPTRHRRNATWIGNIATMNAIRQLGTDDGHQLLARLGDGTPPALIGRPFIENPDMDGAINAAATANNYVLILGDFQHYVIAEGLGTVTRFIPDVVGGNGRPIGASAVFMQTQFGADSVLDSAFRMLDVATTA